jgi:hypothetical protein
MNRKEVQKSNRKRSQTAEKPAKYGQFNDCSFSCANVLGFLDRCKRCIYVSNIH